MLLVTLGWATGCGGRERVSPAEPAVVDTTTGALRGTVTADHRVFEAIPYAAAPVGDLRWKPPESQPHWQGTRDATRPGAECPQQIAAVVHGPGDIGGNEDCLFLNVWTPARSAGHERAVMVWFPGGAFSVGDGASYDPSRLVAAGDMIVVTVNYRLGAPGFLADPALAYDGGQVGNFGFLDQQAALRWVREDIAAFGGDPARVTIAGESAGATSVCDHLVSPGSAGLFAAAIVQSGRCQLQGSRETAAHVSTDYAAQLGCGAADPAIEARCLRALPVDRLIATPLNYVTSSGIPTRGPVSGEPVLPDNPVTAIRAGRAAKVPVLIGVNHDEATAFVAAAPPATATQYRDALVRNFGPDADRIAAAYPAANYAHPGSALAAVFTDDDFACPAVTLAESLARGGPVYQYEFDDRTAAAPKTFPAGTIPLGAAHTFELPYLFEVTGLPNLATAAQQSLSGTMIAYWAAFVNSGDPHVANRPDWPRRIGDKVLTLRPDASTTATDFSGRHHCKQWPTRVPS
ncbi:carboxylesterase family protein [Nocardia sp. CA2R105]|uniref:carboxylesterase/lipase family protein n=1 Tax=Nocardia coffeae TaxID=2873381 RepID=UPI001CA6ED58|nr:carboxylesterase family protein [Nocardia coffeae]MBY8861820.1 carboxylesterase family protein [Nocardia coffeae]